MRRAWHSQPFVLHQLLRSEARQIPDRIAYVYEDQWISQGELARRSGSWASRLQRMGVDVGTMVGIYMERSIELPVIVLAVLEAGGVCVPLDPSEPAHRLAEMFGETRPSFILTQDRLRQRLSSTAVPIITVDDHSPECAPALETSVTPNDLAFIFLTSGSTGEPKGVMVSHAVAAARMFRRECDLTDAGACLGIMKTPISNSPFLGEMFAPLLHGCYFAIARPDGHQDIPYIGSLIIQHRVAHIAMTSTMLRAFLDWPDAALCQSLRAVYCGGEAVAEEVRRRFVDCFRKARFAVTYGTTESGHTLSLECDPCQRLDGLRVGRPISNAEVHLFDHNQEPVALRETGEMYLGGSRLAIGYLNRPVLTAEQFVPHPFPNNPGERLYRSGDLGRMEPDGEFEFKGRVDHLVKVAGNRVQLAEVETALAECPGIDEAVVVARDDGRNETQLVAYLVSRQTPEPTLQEIRDHLSRRLPVYMVPKMLLMLGEIPRNLGGKVDRKLLSMSNPRDARLLTNLYVAPQTDTERTLAEIWQQMLGVERISRHDNFFAIGGTSFLAVALIVAIEKRLQRLISLSELYNATDLASLADAVVGEAASPKSVMLVPARSGGKRSPLILMPTMAGRPWISNNLLAFLDPLQNVFALAMSNDDPRWDEVLTLEGIARCYVEAIREAGFEGPLHIGGRSSGGIMAYEVARQLKELGIECGSVVLIDSWLSPSHTLSRWRRLQDVPLVLANLPRWIFHFIFRRPHARQFASIRGYLKRWNWRLMCLFKKPVAAEQVHHWWMDLRRTPEALRKRARTNFNAIQSYVPRPYSGGVVLFRASVRPLFHGLTPDLNWGSVADSVHVIAIPGDHSSIFERPNIEILAARLQATLSMKDPK